MNHNLYSPYIKLCFIIIETKLLQGAAPSMCYSVLKSLYSWLLRRFFSILCARVPKFVYLCFRDVLCPKILWDWDWMIEIGLTRLCCSLAFNIDTIQQLDNINLELLGDFVNATKSRVEWKNISIHYKNVTVVNFINMNGICIFTAKHIGLLLRGISI